MKKLSPKSHGHSYIFRSLIITIPLLFLSIFTGVKANWINKKEMIEVPIIQNEAKAIEAIATWYDYDLNRADQKCRSEDCYSKHNSTCASRDFKRKTILTIRYEDKEIDCIVNDYIEHPERDIDLSSYAFKQLAPLSRGIIKVEIVNIKNN